MTQSGSSDTCDGANAGKDAILLANQKHRQAMFHLIESGEAIGFVGAGLSHPLYPTWQEFLETLENKAVELTHMPISLGKGLSKGNVLDYAEAIKRHFSDHASIEQYFAIFGTEFAPKHGRCTEQQKKLLRLPFKGFVTTNYEESLEQAAHDCGETRRDCSVVIKPDDDHHLVTRFLLGLDDKIQPRRIAHLHGIHSETRQIIFTRSEYEHAYGVGDGGSWQLHRKLIWALLATRRLVFVGTSLDDPYLNQLLEMVADDLWKWGQPIHYLVSPLDAQSIARQQSDQARFNNYGICVVYFDNFDGTYRGLDQLINEAVARCGKSDAAQWLESVNADVEKTLRPT
jgi:hypothetical protein